MIQIKEVVVKFKYSANSKSQELLVDTEELIEQITENVFEKLKDELNNHV